LGVNVTRLEQISATLDDRVDGLSAMLRQHQQQQQQQHAGGSSANTSISEAAGLEPMNGTDPAPLGVVAALEAPVGLIDDHANHTQLRDANSALLQGANNSPISPLHLVAVANGSRGDVAGANALPSVLNSSPSPATGIPPRQDSEQLDGAGLLFGTLSPSPSAIEAVLVEHAAGLLLAGGEHEEHAATGPTATEVAAALASSMQTPAGGVGDGLVVPHDELLLHPRLHQQAHSSSPLASVAVSLASSLSSSAAGGGSLGFTPSPAGLPSLGSGVPVPAGGAHHHATYRGSGMLPDLPLPPSSYASSGVSSSGSFGGTGAVSVFKLLTKKLKDLEIDQSVVHSYLTDMAGTYSSAVGGLQGAVEGNRLELAQLKGNLTAVTVAQGAVIESLARSILELREVMVLLHTQHVGLVERMGSMARLQQQHEPLLAGSVGTSSRVPQEAAAAGLQPQLPHPGDVGARLGGDERPAPAFDGRADGASIGTRPLAAPPAVDEGLLGAGVNASELDRGVHDASAPAGASGAADSGGVPQVSGAAAVADAGAELDVEDDDNDDESAEEEEEGRFFPVLSSFSSSAMLLSFAEAEFLVVEEVRQAIIATDDTDRAIFRFAEEARAALLPLLGGGDEAVGRSWPLRGEPRATGAAAGSVDDDAAEGGSSFGDGTAGLRPFQYRTSVAVAQWVSLFGSAGPRSPPPDAPFWERSAHASGDDDSEGEDDGDGGGEDDGAVPAGAGASAAAPRLPVEEATPGSVMSSAPAAAGAATAVGATPEVEVDHVADAAQLDAAAAVSGDGVSVDTRSQPAFVSNAADPTTASLGPAAPSAPSSISEHTAGRSDHIPVPCSTVRGSDQPPASSSKGVGSPADTPLLSMESGAAAAAATAVSSDARAAHDPAVHAELLAALAALAAQHAAAEARAQALSARHALLASQLTVCCVACAASLCATFLLVASLLCRSRRLLIAAAASAGHDTGGDALPATPVGRSASSGAGARAAARPTRGGTGRAA